MQSQLICQGGGTIYLKLYIPKTTSSFVPLVIIYSFSCNSVNTIMKFLCLTCMLKSIGPSYSNCICDFFLYIKVFCISSLCQRIFRTYFLFRFFFFMKLFIVVLGILYTDLFLSSAWPMRLLLYCVTICISSIY